MNILLGLTGSVASTLSIKLVKELLKVASVKVVITENSKHFINIDELSNLVEIFDDSNEWKWKKGSSDLYFGAKDCRTQYKKDDKVLHIELRNWADAFLIAPCSANTLAKIANGYCDNLLTSVARCWDFKKHFFIALAMNTNMLEHPATKNHINTLLSWGIDIIPSQTKKLACGDVGDGALANISDIIDTVCNHKSIDEILNEYKIICEKSNQILNFNIKDFSNDDYRSLGFEVFSKELNYTLSLFHISIRNNRYPIKLHYSNSPSVTEINSKIDLIKSLDNIIYSDNVKNIFANLTNKSIKRKKYWIFPLEKFTPLIPSGEHPGAFGFKRKYDIHSGVDLYCNENDNVLAVEDGEVVAIEPFTGPKAGHPWWLDTMCVAISGETGLVNYGEIKPLETLKIGDKIKAGEKIGTVIPCLKEGKERKDIPGHSRFMLHIELYKKGTKYFHKGWQYTDKEKPEELLDPTEYLMDSLICCL